MTEEKTEVELKVEDVIADVTTRPTLESLIVDFAKRHKDSFFVILNDFVNVVVYACAVVVILIHLFFMGIILSTLNNSGLLSGLAKLWTLELNLISVIIVMFTVKIVFRILKHDPEKNKNKSDKQ